MKLNKTELVGKIEEFDRAQKAFNIADRELRLFFLPHVITAIEEKNRRKLKVILKLLPECPARFYLWRICEDAGYYNLFQ